MSLLQAQQMGTPRSGQSGPYGGVALGHVPQQPNLGLGPNRYVPPTFDWGRGGLDGNQRQTSQMNWNQMQDYYLPSQNGQRPGANQYGDAVQQMLAQFQQQYGGAGRRPQLPQFSSYDPGFGGPTSYYDQQRGSMGGRGGSSRGYYNSDGSDYDDPFTVRAAVGVAGDDHNPMYDSGGNRVNQPGRTQEWRSGGRGGSRGGGFNPYQLMQQNLGGMSQDEMFDPRWASIFGGRGFGQMQPNRRPTAPEGPGIAGNIKPYQVGGGG